MRRWNRKHRRGTTLVEFAVTLPIVLLMLIGTMIGAVGVSRYQQVAAAARAGSRWASVHGAQYAKDTGNPAATPQDVLDQAIKPASPALDPAQLSYSVEWDQSNMPLQVGEDPQNPSGNSVTVTVNYQWSPGVFFVGPMTLTSSSTVQMAY